MYTKYILFIRKNETSDYTVLEFNDLEDAYDAYEEFISEECFDCAIYRRFHHSYVSI